MAFSDTLLGKQCRINRIIDPSTNKTVIVPVDDSLLFGPFSGLETMDSKLKDITGAKPNAVLAFRGAFRNHPAYFENIPGIMNLTASTVKSIHTRKIIIGSVVDAVRMGMDGVAAHVNVSSKYENEMLSNIGIIYRECERFGMPLIAIMYPRREGDGCDDNYEELRQSDPESFAKLVAHSCRIAVELGADIIKTQFTGDVDTFRTVIEASKPIPVVIAGGPKLKPLDALRNASDALNAGAAGISYGRNVFSRRKSSAFIFALKKVVHEGKEPEDVLKNLNY
jgi:DhnA family fructose-bisphosphate aldolase class Ia